MYEADEAMMFLKMESELMRRAELVFPKSKIVKVQIDRKNGNVLMDVIEMSKVHNYINPETGLPPEPGSGIGGFLPLARDFKDSDGDGLDDETKLTEEEYEACQISSWWIFWHKSSKTRNWLEKMRDNYQKKHKKQKV
jgi:hypothetical protein